MISASRERSPPPPCLREREEESVIVVGVTMRCRRHGVIIEFISAAAPERTQFQSVLVAFVCTSVLVD